MPNPKTINQSNGISSYNPYDLLRIYTYYRTLLGSVLLLMFQLEFVPKILGTNSPDLFFYTSLFYTAINFFSLLLMWRLKFNPSGRNLFISLFIDVASITLLMHSSGGPLSGLGYLLLIAIAAGGIMLREQISTLLAAICTILVITEGTYSYLNLQTDNKSLFASAALGALTFLTSLIFQYLTRRIRLSHEEALLQAAHAAHLQRLAQQIIERMRTGIVVLDKDQQIELMNQSARNLLGVNDQQANPNSLRELPDLLEKYRAWQLQPTETALGKPTLAHTNIKANFAHLEPGNLNETLIFVEDIRALHQQAQQLKLASLGRLTASIAHEVRNPLGAISHASQLLGESEDISHADKRLLNIIDTHSKRVNQIIENILQLSRRRPANPQRINLEEWLPAFIKDYLATKESGKRLNIELDSPSLKQQTTMNSFGELDDEPPGIHAKFDPSQLQQVLTNLCDNGIRYGLPMEDRADLRIEIGIDSQHRQPYIQVIDFGPGVSPDTIKHLFEPFFTTENTGSGLGLYICKEICEANQAYISYKRTTKGQSCFHIQLAHPNKAL